jgi:2-polyprenyl-3-methyl-5-hydroxy-6-metoxy-1,4-benzoquinol methylase
MPTGVLLVAERAVTFAGTLQPAPKRILDVGCGYGKYGVLLREYLDPDPVVDGVEAWEPYVIDHNLRGIYNNVFVMDVCKMPQGVLDTYDMVVMGDVIEHIEKEAAIDLLSRIKGWVIIATPFDHFHTDEGLPPTEAHVSHWTEQDFKNTGRLDRYEVSYGSHVVRLAPLTNR